jgi:hypothetical protein
MIEVRIRQAGDATSVHLMDWADPNDLDGAVRVLTEWGVRWEDGEEFASLSSFTGGIVVEGGRAFFEITCEAGE